MSYSVLVTVKGVQGDIYGPATTKEDAERELGVIKSSLGSPESINLPWIAVLGRDVIAARIIEMETGGP